MDPINYFFYLFFALHIVDNSTSAHYRINPIENSKITWISFEIFY